jgi:hypothetical protein
MRKNFILTLAAAAILGPILLAGLIRTSNPTPGVETHIPNSPAVSTTTSALRKIADTPQSQIASPASNVTVSVEGYSYGAYIAENESVLDVMRQLAASQNFAFTGREYPSLGFFVESINGKKNADGAYWFLYVNGTSSDTGASQTMLHAGDVVEWRYEKNH